jgi:hypothetical protein
MIMNSRPLPQMMNMKKCFYLLLLVLATGCKKDTEKDNPVIIFSASGDITAKANEFRSQLGVLNTTPGVTGGRREINWDGVPDSLTGIKLAPDFFNATNPGAPASRQRGLVYAGTSDAMVSKTNFTEVNASAAPSFSAFSGNKTFAVVNSSLWPVEFTVPGQNTLATVKGFGLVVVDADKDNSTFLEFFNEDRSLGVYYVPAHTGSSNFSFLGVYFKNEVITMVKIGHEGRLADGEKDISNGGNKDLVVFDDFIYSEPAVK